MLIVDTHAETDTLICPGCGAPYSRVFGTVRDGDQRTAVYFADLHSDNEGHHVLLVIGTMIDSGEHGAWEKRAIVLQVWSDDDQIHFRLSDDSTRVAGIEHLNLGRTISREELSSSSARDRVFHLAEHMVQGDPRITPHLG